MDCPDDRKYHKEHTWAKPLSDGSVLVGITDFAQSELGDIVFVELPKQGEKVNQGEPMGQVESLKSISDLFCPVSGVVAEVNGEVLKKPESINTSAYADGWLVRITADDPRELENLLDAVSYEAETE